MDVRQYAPRRKAPLRPFNPEPVVPLADQLGLGPRRSKPKRARLNAEQRASRLRKLTHSLLAKV